MATSRSTWKQSEAKVAKAFGTTRTPLSGGNSKITRSDTLHTRLFIENKYRAKCAVRSLWDKTNELAIREQKVPLLTLHAKNRKGFLVVMHSDDLDYLLLVLRKARRESQLASEGVAKLPSLLATQDPRVDLSVPWD